MTRVSDAVLKSVTENGDQPSASDWVDIIDSKLNAVQTAAVSDLDQTISAEYSQAEVQAISDKVDALLAALRTSEQMAT